MMTTPLSYLDRSDEGFERAGTTRHAVVHGLFDQRHSQLSGLRPDFTFRGPAAYVVPDAMVQVHPIESVERHVTGSRGMLAETIYGPSRSRIEVRFHAPLHLLVMYEDGAHRDGETSIDGLAPSRLRHFANKLTFVPAGHAYHEWHETITPLRVTYLYLDPAAFQQFADARSAYMPRAFFENAVLWGTAAKLKTAIESGERQGGRYLEALANVLGHELSHLCEEPARSSPVSRGSLAGWQMRVVTAYVEEHLDERIYLTTLARLARLSVHHFCRAFKQSFGMPPHRYHVQRRIDRAKTLLADRANSITDVGLSLGYSHSSAFTSAFREMTGQTPSRFRRNFVRGASTSIRLTFHEQP
jgi:AraC family transcriptional regulator